MGRHREFDRHQVLQRALEAFRENGYEGTSLQDLVDRMGIGRASLYDTFGSKEALFAEAMELYTRENEARVLAPLRAPGSPRRVLARFFSGLVDDHACGTTHACLMVKSALSNRCGGTNQDARIRAGTEAMDAAFHALLVRARARGELAEGRSPTELARFFTNTVHGLVVTARIRPDRRLMKGIVRVALSTLDR